MQTSSTDSYDPPPPPPASICSHRPAARIHAVFTVKQVAAMRNVKVSSALVIDTWLSRSDVPSATEIEATCVNDEQRIFCACRAGLYELSSSEQQPQRVVNWSLQQCTILSFDYLCNEYMLCAVLSSGTVITVDYDAPKMEHHQVPFGVQEQMCSAMWAPDYHLLLVASSETLYFVTPQFDILKKQQLSSATSGREELTTLGWGSKETQFQGITARMQLKQGSTEKPTVVGEYDQRRVLLAWHGDANYVVVSYVEHETNFRRFCVFDHEGELISRLVQISNVEEAIAYRPTGNLIATSQLQESKRWVIFFERNGQRRSQFEIGPHEGTLIVWMGWNIDGSILCVRLKYLEGTTQEVQFWCASNYDWMLKYRIVAASGFLLACWHGNNPNQFCYVTCNGRAAFVDFDFAYDFCDGTVLSITGCKVRVSNLKVTSIPPPLCHYEITFPSTVCEVALYKSTAAFLLADHSLHAYKLNEGKFKKYGEYDAAGLPEECICYNLCLNDEGRLSAIVASSLYNLYSFSLKNADHQKSSCLYSSEKPFMWHHYATDGFLLQGTDGIWLSVKNGKDKQNNYREAGKLFTTASTLQHCRHVSATDSIFGISKGNDLVMNGRSLLRHVGSYVVDQKYLLVVTYSSQSASSKLQIVKLENASTAGNEISCKESRSIEKGAVLIGHEAGGTRVWLQMPRGNLETIHLRELLLSKLKKLINNLHFKEAALIMKKHRIDMNLFYDHNPEFFMEHIGQFVEDIGNAELLNLFVTNLNNYDVTMGMYSENYNKNNNSGGQNLQTTKNRNTKVQSVCASLRNHILGLVDTLTTELYTTVISTYLKEKPPQISKALLSIRERSSKTLDGLEVEEKWISYVSLLAPNENLFKVALSTYDLSLTLTVARNSQMDPKEYLPLLADFQAQKPLAYQKSKIDIYLGLFERAIRNLSEVDDSWDETAEIIKRQNLYVEALAIYRGKKTYPKACELCANHLMDKRRFEEAALLFKRSGNMSMALRCYQSAHNWKQVVECGQLLDMKKEAIKDLLQKMIPHFENSGKFGDAAGILSFIDEESNKGLVLEYYCKADAWNSAVNLIYGDEELTKALCERACARCKQILRDVEKWENLLQHYSCRLEVVRQNKKDALKTVIERLAVTDLSLSEAFSETSTTVSDISKTSAASAASARRQKHVEKKKKVLKEGSQYEDAALLNALKDVVSVIDSRQDELVVLLPTLISVDAVEEARNLQSRFLALIKHIHEVTEAAWPLYLLPHLIPGPLREIYRGEDGVMRLPEENTMPLRIPLGLELMRPHIRNVSWQLEICN